MRGKPRDARQRQGRRRERKESAATANRTLSRTYPEIAKVLNSGRSTVTAGECRAVLGDVRVAVACILEIFGREVRR